MQWQKRCLAHDQRDRSDRFIACTQRYFGNGNSPENSADNFQRFSHGNDLIGFVAPVTLSPAPVSGGCRSLDYSLDDDADHSAQIIDRAASNLERHVVDEPSVLAGRVDPAELAGYLAKLCRVFLLIISAYPV